MLPEWAAGFWQCKLRYQTQDELLAVAREHKRRGLPMSVIVIDYIHWTKMGEWKFDPACWPDPAAMVKELESLGIKVMVSVWPTVNPDSENFAGTGAPQSARPHRARVEQLHQVHRLERETHRYLRPARHAHIPTRGNFSGAKCAKIISATASKFSGSTPSSRRWSTYDHDNVRYHAGNGLEVGCLYPMCQQQAFYEGMKSAGETEIITLGRAGFAGSQRYGAAIWSGDIHSTWEDLQQQVRAGLNIGLSGIPWWTTDIGGFFGGEIDTPYFQELIVRWFQYGVFCPLFRLHGWRNSSLAHPETC